MRVASGCGTDAQQSGTSLRSSFTDSVGRFFAALGRWLAPPLGVVWAVVSSPFRVLRWCADLIAAGFAAITRTIFEALPDTTLSLLVAFLGIVTLLRLLHFPFIVIAQRRMLQQRALRPQMARIQAEHRGNREAMNEQMMKLYQLHKVNPLSSCLYITAFVPFSMGGWRMLSGLTLRDASMHFSPRYLHGDSALARFLTSRGTLQVGSLDLLDSISTHDFCRGAGSVLWFGGGCAAILIITAAMIPGWRALSSRERWLTVGIGGILPLLFFAALPSLILVLRAWDAICMVVVRFAAAHCNRGFPMSGPGLGAEEATVLTDTALDRIVPAPKAPRTPPYQMARLARFAPAIATL